MTDLYNCKSVLGGYRITKFNTDLEPQSSYVLIESGDRPGVYICECPAGLRKSCRHRDMLPAFIAKGRVDTHWMAEWNDGTENWRQYVGPFEDAPGHTDLMVSPEAIDEALGYKPFTDLPTVAEHIELPPESSSTQVAEAFAGLRDPNYVRRRI